MWLHEHTWLLCRTGRKPRKYRWYHRQFPRLFLRLGDSLQCPCGCVQRWVKYERN